MLHCRCHRLGKECIPSATVRKRGSRGTTASKRAQLEDKLDDIVTLLRTQNIVQPVSSRDPSMPTPGSSNPSPHHSSIAYGNDISITEYDLANFRDNYLRYFPFILLPANITAEHLQLGKPVLCLAIHTICTKAVPRQTLLSTLLRETLASKIIVSGERSIDLLLSLIVCITW
ncbi:uncharacterized protein K460DRAFT_131548 [Cucurbitaria berberidis CBS 394.84]|uniref:Transcription factor domain-containing protein n=1 Tax=Cucurbitaria berberidis CBS 394.84 TaxID=1168544 RepID=A0A9P4GKM4_9PLEO|nr:uncharacterized protein K460DRAFT_131548 [Cucurbitaria berberidis CBS 394.84]KAF1846820.1 hypothetical protein K460DRAFT_131548 [Cucurbitaria berberidis CBS 394.84]